MNEKTIQSFIETFSFLTKFDCIEAIDAMFFKMIKEDWSKESLAVNKMLIVCFCRSNYKIRQKIISYEPFLEKAIDYLKANGIDHKKTLHGLL